MPQKPGPGLSDILGEMEESQLGAWSKIEKYSRDTWNWTGPESTLRKIEQNHIRRLWFLWRDEGWLTDSNSKTTGRKKIEIWGVSPEPSVVCCLMRSASQNLSEWTRQQQLDTPTHTKRMIVVKPIERMNDVQEMVFFSFHFPSVFLLGVFCAQEED